MVTLEEGTAHWREGPLRGAEDRQGRHAEGPRHGGPRPDEGEVEGEVEARAAPRQTWPPRLSGAKPLARLLGSDRQPGGWKNCLKIEDFHIPIGSCIKILSRR